MKPTTTKKTLSPEQRKADREALLGTLHTKIDSLVDSGEWARYLTFASAFRRYSFNNQMLIHAQCPAATQVAGYRKWQALGRNVRKGEKAIKILGFATKKIQDTDPTTQEEITKSITWFPTLSVFDISQTEGEAMPLGVVYPTDAGEHYIALEAQLTAYLTTLNYEVGTTDTGTAKGYTQPLTHKVYLSDTLEPAGRVAVLLHEIGHVILHAEEFDPAEYQSHRGIFETEAESVAYVLSHLLGVPADAKSILYITRWASADRKLIHDTAVNVMRAVNQVAQALGLDDETQAEEEVAA